ncbi:MAG: hypothetical protein ACI4QV_01040 [Acutalibacteraceae bacterium]
MKKSCGKSGLIAIAFGAGLLVSCFCPAEVMVAVLAIALIIVGISYLRT